MTKKDKQKIQLAINEEFIEEKSVCGSEDASSCIDADFPSANSKYSPDQELNRKSSKDRVKNIKPPKQQQKKNFKFVTPTAILKGKNKKYKTKSKSPNKMFVTPIAARVKKLTRKISSKPQAGCDDFIPSENNCISDQASTESTSKNCQVLLQSGKSTNQEKSAIAEKPKNKKHSFVTTVFAAKIAKSSTMKASKNASSKVKSINSKTKQSAIRRPNKNSDDLVTKYLKKFKDTISPKKNVNNKLLNTVKDSSNKQSQYGSKATEVEMKRNICADTEGKSDSPATQLPKIKKSGSKKSLHTLIEKDDVFKRPDKPLSHEKERKSNKRKSSSSINYDADSPNDLEDMTNYKSSKRNSLRSSRR